jgi:hypothetical protein
MTGSIAALEVGEFGNLAAAFSMQPGSRDDLNGRIVNCNASSGFAPSPASRTKAGSIAGVEQGNFDTYPVVRFKDAPKTEVYITPTPGKRWGGVGEPGATMIQPAVTNAIFAATSAISCAA